MRKSISSFRRKPESSASDSEHVSQAAFQFEPLLDSCRADARRWIPAFAGMTALIVRKLCVVAFQRMNRYGILSAIFVIIIACPAPAFGASKETDLGSFGVWHSYAYDEGGQTVCYMLTSKNTKASGKNKDRISYLMITHRPVEASTDVFSYGAGEQLDSKHGVTLKIGKNAFDLFSVRDTAWARDARIDHKLAAAIRTSETAQTSGYSSQKRVAPIKDQFSLTGALPAYRAINKACGLPDVEGKKAVAKKSPPKKKVAKKTGKKPLKKKAHKRPVIVKPVPAAAKASQ
jgi:hypothetical protein